MCFILRLAPCFVATARAVLLSALACVKNDSLISFSMACAKINSAVSAPRAYISDSPEDKRFSSRAPFKYLNTFLARVNLQVW